MVNVQRVLASVGALGIVEAAPSVLEAVIGYEVWRAGFMAGSASLVSVEGQKLTTWDTVPEVVKRRRKVRRASK